ncbi:MAG TPA: hypothetical protein VGC78_07460 [Gaiellaceae bacterium]
MPPLAAVPDLERELDALYALPLEEFTRARNDLSTRLRKAHQAEAAAEVKALKKPTLVAWTANRLARENAELVSRLVDAGAALRDVQQRALAGNADQAEVAAAAGRERDAVRELVARARHELGERATAQTLDRLSQTLRAAAVDPERAQELAAGRLTEELRAVGFGSLQAVTPQRRRESPAEARAARERLEALRAEARRLAHEAQEAERAAHEADREAARLHAEADRLRSEADDAATALADAEGR